MSGWNPWHGCHKISSGCLNCYVYRMDANHEKDASVVKKTMYFDLPLKKKRNGSYKLTPEDGIVYTCFTSDFFVDDADEYRNEAWAMMKKRDDLKFLFITKRIHRFYECIPPNWGDGYENVAICCTAENQAMADKRLPIYAAAPIKHKMIICEPLLEKIDISAYLTSEIEAVVAGGESGNEARVCDYDWILSLKEQCAAANVPFAFKQTGAHFIKNGRLYNIPRKLQHTQARKAGIDTYELRI